MIPYFDAHCDTIVAWGDILKNPGHLDAERLSAFSPRAQIFAICCTEDMPGGYAKYLPMLKAQIEGREDMVLCRSAEDRKSRRRGRKAGGAYRRGGRRALSAAP
jgi:hypothetical protein